MLAKIIVFVVALISEICIHIIICGRKKNDIFKSRKTKQIQGIYNHGLLTQTDTSRAKQEEGLKEALHHLNFQAQSPFAGVCFGKAFWKKSLERDRKICSLAIPAEAA